MNKIICISRQYASGGHEIGRQLSQHFHIPNYDKELITESMKASGLSRELIESNDENARNSFIYSIAMGQLSNFATPYIAPPGDKVYQAQSEAIRKLAAQGPCIIIGRCAGEILRDNPDSVRIFIYANDRFRVERAIRYYGCESSKAVNVLRTMDKQRAAHFNYYCSRHWGTMDSFDLAIDNSRCGIEGSVQVIVEYLDTIVG